MPNDAKTRASLDAGTDAAREEPTSAGRPILTARTVGAAALTLYGLICLLKPEYRLLDHVDLAIHETGHLVFGPFGEFIGFAGGTLFQLLMPAAFYVYFRRHGDRFAAAVVLWWIAQNLWNIAVYVRDARSQLLPLVGGGEHDWTYLLGTLGLLQYDQELGKAVHLAGVLLFGYSVFRAFQYARKTD